MKRHLLTLASAVLAASVLFISGCSKDDTEAPVISLNGANPMTISLNTPNVTDPGATAEDNEDGTLQVSSDWSTTNPNVNVKGTYTVTYTVTDAAGNAAEEHRTVNVVNDIEFLAGNYLNAFDSCQSGQSGTFNASIITSDSVNNMFFINNFGGFGTPVNIQGTRSGNNLSFASSQSLGGTSSLIAGSGTITSGGSPTTFNTSYTWTDGSSTEVCISRYSK